MTPPAHGTLSGTAPNLVYTPAAGYTGFDSFTFKANDGQVDSSIATMTIDVGTTGNRRPVAINQSVTTAQNTAKAITLTGTDPDGDPLNYAIVSSPAHGTLSGAPPNVTYLPATNYPGGNFNGADSFTFAVSDGSLTSAVATVSITVTPAGPVVANAVGATNLVGGRGATAGHVDQRAGGCAALLGPDGRRHQSGELGEHDSADEHDASLFLQQRQQPALRADLLLSLLRVQPLRHGLGAGDRQFHDAATGEAPAPQLINLNIDTAAALRAGGPGRRQRLNVEPGCGGARRHQRIVDAFAGSNGAATTVGFTLSAGNLYTWGSPALTMLARRRLPVDRNSRPPPCDQRPGAGQEIRPLPRQLPSE